MNRGQGQATMHPISSNHTNSSSSSPEWYPSLKNPRVYRASRSPGGKPQHSKVCTIRGLRDRRISLPLRIAIQLYDLQQLLGLNQPSKVVDWLLDTAKLEIEKLPPLMTQEQTQQEQEEEGFMQLVANNQWPYMNSSGYSHWDQDPNLNWQNLSSSSSHLQGGVGVGVGVGIPSRDQQILSSSQLYHLCHSSTVIMPPSSGIPMEENQEWRQI